MSSPLYNVYDEVVVSVRNDWDTAQDWTASESRG